MPVETILAYMNARYVAGNIAIAASGKLSHESTVARIKSAFETLRKGPRQARPTVPEPPQTVQRRAEVGVGTQVAEIRLGWPVAGAQSEASSSLAIIQELLGESGRRLEEELRDRRALVTSVGARYAAFTDAGTLMLSASTQPDRVGQVVELMLAEVQRLRDGDLSEEDVHASSRALAGRLVVETESNLAQTARARSEVLGTLESDAEVRARLRGLTPGHIQRAARTYLDTTNHTLIVVRR